MWSHSHGNVFSFSHNLKITQGKVVSGSEFKWMRGRDEFTAYFSFLKAFSFSQKVLIEIYGIWVLLNNNKSSRETSFTLSHTWLNMMITSINNPYTLNHFIASQKCHDSWFKESVTCLWVSTRENVQNLWPTAIVHLCGELNYIYTRSINKLSTVWCAGRLVV